jgi:hypothetical protein
MDRFWAARINQKMLLGVLPISGLHYDFPPLWRGDLQIAPHGGDFPSGLKTRRAQDCMNTFSGQNTRADLWCIQVMPVLSGCL